MEGNQGRRRGGKEGPQSLAVSGLTGYGARRGTPFPPQYPKTRDGLGPPPLHLPPSESCSRSGPGGKEPASSTQTQPLPLADQRFISGWEWVTPGCLHWYQIGASDVRKHV